MNAHSECLLNLIDPKVFPILSGVLIYKAKMSRCRVSPRRHAASGESFMPLGGYLEPRPEYLGSHSRWGVTHASDTDVIGVTPTYSHRQ